jgi:hypothetical protein
MGVRRGKLRLTLQSEFADAEPDVHSAWRLFHTPYTQRAFLQYEFACAV